MKKLWMALLAGILAMPVALADGNDWPNDTPWSRDDLKALADKVVVAINKADKAALTELLHPDCRKAMGQNKDVGLFLDYLLSNKVGAPYTLQASLFKKESKADEYLLKNNRFVVPPQGNMDIIWKTKMADGKEVPNALSLCIVRAEDKLFLVSYMNDYMTPKPKDGK